MVTETLLRTGEAASFLRVSTATLARWRMVGSGPAYIKSGPRIVVYRKSELLNWQNSRVCQSTADTCSFDI